VEEKTKLIRLCIPIPFSEPSLIKAEVTPAFSRQAVGKDGFQEVK
jgi:hypothetical protein